MCGVRGEARCGVHEENTIDYIRKIYELLMASSPTRLSGRSSLGSSSPSPSLMHA